MPNWKRPDIDASIRRGAEVGESVPLFKPKSGDRPGRFADSWIRVLPIREDSEFEEFYYWAAVHFPPGQGGLPFICGRKMFDTYGVGAGFNSSCPACDVAVYGAEGQGTSKWYGVMNVVILNDEGEPEDGRVLIWACPRTVLNDLLGEIEGLPAEQQDITDPETGVAVRVRRKGSGKKDTRYEISLATEAIPLDNPDELLEGLHDITSTYRVLEPSAVTALLGEGGDPFPEEGAAPTGRPRLQAAADGEEEAAEGEYRELPEGEGSKEGEVANEPEEPAEKPQPRPRAPRAAKPEVKSEAEAKTALKKKLQASK